MSGFATDCAIVFGRTGKSRKENAKTLFDWVLIKTTLRRGVEPERGRAGQLPRALSLAPLLLCQGSVEKGMNLCCPITYKDNLKSSEPPTRPVRWVVLEAHPFTYRGRGRLLVWHLCFYFFLINFGRNSVVTKSMKVNQNKPVARYCHSLGIRFSKIKKVPADAVKSQSHFRMSK